MIDPSDLRLPYPSWSPGQWDSITQAALAFDDYKYVVMEAPTGSGKSAVALALSRLMNMRVQMVTGTKQLQDQYESLGPFKLMGRNNFICDFDPTYNADQAICTIGQDCQLRRPKMLGKQEVGPPDCAYYAQRWTGQRAQETVFNYAYWLAMQNYAGWPNAGLLVLDEAHLLEDEIRRFATIQIRRRHVELLHDLGIRWPLIEDDLESWQIWAKRSENAVKIEWDWVSENPAQAGRRRHGAVKGVHDAIDALLKPNVDEDTWVVTPDYSGVKFLPVWVSDLGYPLVYRHASKVLLMSATLLSKRMFCEQIGLAEDEVAYLEIPSTFPAERRPMYYQPAGKIKASSESSLKQLTRDLDEVLLQYPTKHGLVHTGSYKIAQYIQGHSKHARRLVFHTAKDKLAQIERFKETPGAVLVSPSITTGVDLPYELCDFQVICKIPFPDRSDPQVARRMKEMAPGVPNAKGQSWYSWVTICNVIQAYGRGMRAADDRCDTYLLDGNWQWFRHAVRDMLPEWFKAAIKNKPSPGDGTDDIRAQVTARVAGD